jgi:hypothetical protein
VRKNHSYKIWDERATEKAVIVWLTKKYTSAYGLYPWCFLL